MNNPANFSKGIVYYTDNRLPEPLFSTVQEQLKRVAGDCEIVSVSLKPISFGDNYVLGLKRGYLTMFQQILTGLSMLQTDIAFLCEHDVLYGRSHFDFTPPRADRVFYNENVWRLRADTGEALFHYHKSVSQLCADRRLLIDHYRERIARIEQEGRFSFRMGFEPGTRRRSHGGIDDLRSETWFSETPNIDIYHGTNTTKLLWHRSEFRNEKFTAGWRKEQYVPGWPAPTFGRFQEFLAEVRAGRL